ncbi:MAG: PAS domain-containing protein, partial [Singulisphaera sp.]
MNDVESPPLVLMHCGWPGDRDLICRLLGSLGAECLALEPATDLRRLVAEDRLDLVLADSSGGHGPLGDLLGTFDRLPECRDLPIILLADPTDVSMLADLTTRRFHATLLKKPVEPSQLAAAVGQACATGRAGAEPPADGPVGAAHAESERRREEAEEARRRYHDLVHGIELVVWEADAATRHFTFVSRRAEELFGQSSERWLTEPGLWLDRIVPEDREYAGSAWKHGLRDGRDFELEYRATAGDGRTIWIREAVRVARDAQGGTVGLRGLMWNITRKKKAERHLHTDKRLLAEGLDDMSYLHELSTRLSATLELEPMLEEVLAAVMAVQGAEMGLVRLVDRERGDLEIVASVGLPGAFLTRFGRLPKGVAACGKAIVRGEPVLIEDVEADPCDAETREAGRIGGFRGDYSTPLVSRTGAMLGTIA